MGDKPWWESLCEARSVPGSWADGYTRAHAPAFDTCYRKAGIQSVAGSSLLPFTIPVHHVPLRKLEGDQLLSPQEQSGLPVCPPL